MHQELYQKMFQAKQAGDDALVEELLIQMDQARKKTFPAPPKEQVQALLPQLPEFCRRHLGWSQEELGIEEKSNCINAAFNFHASESRWTQYSSMEFLEIIQTCFRQVELNEGQFGDLLVLWSRTGGSWDEKRIVVKDINKTAPDFPYGLVFDHVIVCVSESLAFHKPDPTLQSRYSIELISSIVAPLSENKGFEITLHRKIKDF